MGTHGLDDLPDSPRAVLKHTTVREDAQRVRICFSGEMDLSSAQAVDAAVADALLAYHPRHVDLDLTEVRFVDSSGIHALMRCLTRSMKAGCQLAVTNPQPLIYQVLEVTGVVAALAVTPVPDNLMDF